MATNFDALLSSGDPVLINFYHDQSPLVITDILAQVMEIFDNKVKVIKVNISKYREVASNCGVGNAPVVLLFQNGKQLWKQTRMLSKTDLMDAILDKSFR